MAGKSSAPARASPQDVRKRQEKFISSIAPGSHFHLALNQLPNTRVLVKDAAGRFVWVSDNVPRRHGFAEPAAMVGLDDLAINPPRLAKAYRRDDREVMESGRPLLGKVELAFDEGGILSWHVTNKLPLRDRRGKVIGLAITIQEYGGLEQLPVFDAELRKVIEHIFAHLGEPLSVAELSGLVGVSCRQLERRFRNAVGTSPTGFIVRARLDAACRRLREGVQSINKIALDVGFYDQSAFTRLFHRHFGMTPGEFRHSRRQPLPSTPLETVSANRQRRTPSAAAGKGNQSPVGRSGSG